MSRERKNRLGWIAGWNIDRLVKAAGEEWVARDEDVTPYLLKLFSSAQHTVLILEDDPQKLFTQPQIVKKIEEKLRSGVNFEIIHSGQRKPEILEARRLEYWFANRLRFIPLGTRRPRLEFLVIDGRHTLNKEPDYRTVGVSNPWIIIRWNDEVWARSWWTRFQKVKRSAVGN